MARTAEVTFKSGDLTLEGVLHLPDVDSPLPCVAICHPHPLYGGDMHNNVVMGLAAALPEKGIAALRFNFRGVGGSGGEHTRGVGEVEDAEAAVAFLSLYRGIDGGRLGLAGYSFGASVALETARKEGLIHALALVACPFQSLNSPVGQGLVAPKLFLCGDQDHVIPADQFSFLAKRFVEPREVHIIPGADHFFGGFEREVADLVSGFFARWLGRERQP